jgi:hypothetical protein
MNEEQIVKALANKLPVSDPVPDPTKSQSTLEAEAPIVREVVTETLRKFEQPDQLGALRLIDYFEIPREERGDRQLLEKLDYLFRWGSAEAGSDDAVDVMNALRQLEQRLGLIYRDDKIESLYRYIVLDSERRHVEKEMALING